MSHIIVIRSYKPGDELNCRNIIKEGVMSSMNAAFLGNVVKEFTFQMMILVAAVLFIFFGLPFLICFTAIPAVIFFTYLASFIAHTTKVMEVYQEIDNISRLYMSNAFSCFWIAEAYEPFIMTRNPKDVHYTIMSEHQFRTSNIDVSSQAKRIVGTIGLTKSRNIEKGAWIKRLCVHKKYRRKGIATYLLNAAVQFSIKQGYSCANIVASEYTEGGRELCLSKGFELQQIYNKPVVGTLITTLMFELSYTIKNDDFYGNSRKYD